MILPRPWRGSFGRDGAALSVINQFSMLVVIALCVAVTIVSGVHLGRHYGLVNADLLRSINLPSAARTVTAGTPSAQDAAERQEAGLTPPNQQVDAGGLLPAASSDPSIAGTAPSPSIMTRGPLHAGLWVPILMYHYIRDSPDRAGAGLSVLPSAFAAQMHYLKDNGYNTVTMSQLDLALMGKGSLPANPVALTFDDGYNDFYATAVPVLRPLGMTATNYIPTMLVGRPDYMTWPEIELLDSEGFEMAAHSQFHVDVSKVPIGRAQVEIFGSKADLEAHLAHPVTDWAYPYGGASYATAELVHQAGYWSGVTTVDGGWHDAAQMPLLTRIRVQGGETLSLFADNLHHG